MHSNKKITKRIPNSVRNQKFLSGASRIDEFNMLIVGTGGQGQITLLQILAEAVLIEGLDFKSSELHGLSQRGGSVEVHFRFGRKIYSPMVSARGADLILGLEMQEALMAEKFAHSKTKFLINQHIVPLLSGKNLPEKEILNQLRTISKDIFLVPASETCQKELGSNVVAGIYLISLASFKKLIPLKPASILKAIRKIIPEKYLELNQKAFELASKQK